MDETSPIVEPAVPVFLSKTDTGGRRATRLDLAKWLCSTDNPLTARTFANRQWRHFFGTGISKVLENLGFARRVANAEMEELIAAAIRAVDDADAVVLEDYNKGLLVPALIDPVISRAKGRGIPVVVDPKYRNFFSYAGATIFKPNLRELESALGAEVNLEQPEALPATFERLGVEHLLLTLGEKGMALISSDGEIGRIPTTAREVYDVVGAGDTVTAYLATMLAAGGTPAEAAVIANFAAGVEIGKLGAATVQTDEVIAAYDDFSESVASGR